MSLYKDHKSNKDYQCHSKVKKWSKRYNSKLTRNKLKNSIVNEFESPIEREAFEREEFWESWEMNQFNINTY